MKSTKLLALASFAAASLGGALACDARPRHAHPPATHAAAIVVAAPSATIVVAPPSATPPGRAAPTRQHPGRPLTGPDGRPAAGNVIGRGARGE